MFVRHLVGCLLFATLGLGFSAWNKQTFLGSHRKGFSLSATVASPTSPSDTTTEQEPPPSWESLKESLPEVNEEEPLLTLYRDTNGWCPFCERVWVALRFKGIPYTESLVSLQNKPEWYKQLVPTSLVPAVLFHESPDTSERTIVWESMAILEKLDDRFPDTPKLMHLDNKDFQKAMKMNDEVTSAGFQFTYGGRNQTLTDEERNQRRQRFSDVLDELDAALQASEGPYRLGKEFSGLDVIMIPTLERWRHQLPITADFDILEGRPHLRKWFDTLDNLSPYADRVAGDSYSWTATASMFLRYFGGGEDKPEVAAGIARADKAAQAISESFSSYEDASGTSETAALEAATKLITNHEAVIGDCTREDALSQKDIPRASNKEVADLVLRYVASILVASFDSKESPSELARTMPLLELSDDLHEEGALVARTVAARVCVPRDMGAPAAGNLRSVLSIVSSRLENDN